MGLSISRREVGEHRFDEQTHPLLQRIFAARGIADETGLDLSLKQLLPFEKLLGIEQASTLLADALQMHRKILVVADFDADGATSCAVAIRGLRAMGAECVEYLVPNRFEYGYGLTPEIVSLAEQRAPDLLITVDNGISSFDGVAKARAAGIDVLVTDHHLPGDGLPDANAIVNPNQRGDSFPSKALAGVGVMFYVLLALRQELRERAWFTHNNLPEPKLADLLDLVALGTVADVVPLDFNNRILVEQGLRRIRAGKTVAGVEALVNVAGIDRRRISSSDLGFSLGPRLNAAGRLSDMALGIECLVSDDRLRCEDLAQKLHRLNTERREIEREMRKQAVDHLDALSIDEESLPAGVALFDPDWHQGVVGILASRVKDQCYRPCIAFARDGAGNLKGSGRSIPGLHLRDLLERMASTHPDLLSKFGGHAMAAGLSICETDYPQFAQLFSEYAAAFMDKHLLQKTIETDGALDDSCFDLSLAEQLRVAAPWGQAFPAPAFDNKFNVVSQRIVGENHVKLKLKLLDGQRTLDAIAFNAVNEDWVNSSDTIQAVYRLETNDYRDVRSVQLLIEHAFPLA